MTSTQTYGQLVSFALSDSDDEIVKISKSSTLAVAMEAAPVVPVGITPSIRVVENPLRINYTIPDVRVFQTWDFINRISSEDATVLFKKMQLLPVAAKSFYIMIKRGRSYISDSSDLNFYNKDELEWLNMRQTSYRLQSYNNYMRTGKRPSDKEGMVYRYVILSSDISQGSPPDYKIQASPEFYLGDKRSSPPDYKTYRRIFRLECFDPTSGIHLSDNINYMIDNIFKPFENAFPSYETINKEDKFTFRCKWNGHNIFLSPLLCTSLFFIGNNKLVRPFINFDALVSQTLDSLTEALKCGDESYRPAIGEAYCVHKILRTLDAMINTQPNHRNK